MGKQSISSEDGKGVQPVCVCVLKEGHRWRGQELI